MPEVIPISELRKRQAEIVDELRERPKILTQRGRGAAILVGLKQWERLVDRLDELEDTVAALQAELALATGEDELVDWQGDSERVSSED